MSSNGAGWSSGSGEGGAVFAVLLAETGAQTATATETAAAPARSVVGGVGAHTRSPPRPEAHLLPVCVGQRGPCRQATCQKRPLLPAELVVGAGEPEALRPAFRHETYWKIGHDPPV
eukprot:scaffold4831_cov47-Phaeocystis_antarctica.AAC.2